MATPAAAADAAATASTTITPPGGVTVSQETARALLARESVVVELPGRKGSRTTDLRPFIVAIEPGEGMLRLVTAITQAGTARPEAVIRVLFGEQAAGQGGFRIRRTALNLSPPA